MKETLTPVTAILLYMFFCGSLYLFGFWSNFDIDISSLINIWDIPKSFVYPFLYSAGLGILVIYILFALKSHFNISISISDNKNLAFKYFTVESFLTKTQILSIILIVIQLLAYKYLENKYLFWRYVPIFLIFSLFTQLLKIETINVWVYKRPINSYLFILLVLTPILSFTYGKIGGMNIYHNKNITYILPIKNDINSNVIFNDSTKFLGYLGSNLIGSSLNNNKIFIYNQSELKILILSKIVPEKKILITQKKDTSTLFKKTN